MQTRRSWTRSRLWACSLVVVAAAATIGMEARPSGPLSLWEPVSPAASPDRDRAAATPWLLMEQVVRIHQPILDALSDLSQPHPVDVALTLATGLNHRLAIDSRKSAPLNTTVIVGHLQQIPHSEVTFIIRGETLAGSIHLNQQVFRIQSTGPGIHILSEIAPDRLPPD